MSIEVIKNPVEFFQKLGGLHDVRIRLVEFDVATKWLTLVVNDLNSNFADLPEDPGRRPCKLLFRGVEAVSLDIETAEGVRISDAEVFGAAPKFRLEIDLNLGGSSMTGARKGIVVTFELLQISDS